MTQEYFEIDNFDETYCLVSSPDRGLMAELSAYFTFKVPKAEFTPAFRNKVWDGKIRLLNEMTGRIYKGLIPYVEKFCKDRDYQVKKENGLSPGDPDFDLKLFLPRLQLKLTPYEEQEIAINHAIKSGRCVLLSPTASGKSLIQYAITRYYFAQVPKKILICVPTVNLVHQMFTDFESYSDAFDVQKNVHMIYEGQPKVTDKKIVISTWQSIYKMKKEFFAQFDFIMVDECHTMKADALKGLLEKSATAKYRIGLTGTLDDTECHRLIIEGLCGAAYQVTTTKDLMDQGKVSKLEIICAILKYPDVERKEAKKFKYPDEMKFIVNHKRRTNFICKMINLVPDDRNILVLTAYRDHIKILEQEIKAKTKKKVLVVTGDVDSLDREAIRKLAEQENNLVIIATYGVYSTGVNIKNLQYIIKSTPSKSVVRVLQSIGRGLRKDGKHNMLKVIDIIDDFSHGSKKNYLYLHFFERIKIYINQKFTYKLQHINI